VPDSACHAGGRGFESRRSRSSLQVALACPRHEPSRLLIASVQTLDRQKLKERIHELYRSEHDEMGERGTLERLERGRGWDLAPTLASGGVAVFSHAGVLDCGHQVAAAVHGCLDSGADRVIVTSVLHAFTDEMQEARTRVSAGEPGRGARGRRGRRAVPFAAGPSASQSW
jgi:hypothetical protein